MNGWGIGGQAVASPIAANGYDVVNESGTFAVLRAGSQLDVAAVNKLGESVRANLAIAGDTLYVRSVDEFRWGLGRRIKGATNWRRVRKVRSMKPY